jgi:hypothetical protein
VDSASSTLICSQLILQGYPPAILHTMILPRFFGQ